MENNEYQISYREWMHPRSADRLKGLTQIKIIESYSADGAIRKIERILGEVHIVDVKKI